MHSKFENLILLDNSLFFQTNKLFISFSQVWGDNQWTLEQQLISSHEFVPTRPYTTGISILDVASLYFWQYGGLFSAFNKMSVSTSFEARIKFTVSATNSGKGISAVLTTKKHTKGKHLLAFNLHLDPFNVNDSQKLQLEQASTFISDCLGKVQAMKIPLQDVSVIVCGDFNIHPEQAEWAFIKGAFGWDVRDLNDDCASKIGRKPALTFVAENKYNASGGHLRIDHIFGIDSFMVGDEKVRLNPVKVGNCFVLDKPDAAMSDHFGIVTELQL